jgi:hypothetical protein
MVSGKMLMYGHQKLFCPFSYRSCTNSSASAMYSEVDSVITSLPKVAWDASLVIQSYQWSVGD